MVGFLAPTPTKSIVNETVNACNKDASLAGNHMSRLSMVEFILMACDAIGSKQLQEQLATNAEVKLTACKMLQDQEVFLALAKDAFGNFVIQRMISETPIDSILHSVEQNSLQLSFDRYACRVVQKYINFASVGQVQRLLNEKFAGYEAQIVQNINASHVIQAVLDKHVPNVYAPFIKACVASLPVKAALEDKFGCRVFQSCLERIVRHCSNPGIPRSDKTSAYELLHILIVPILRDAKNLAENEYANYVVQYILRCEFLVLQRSYIIRNSILHNILWLSQGKFASHVVEQAFVYADPYSLTAMFNEVLDGYMQDMHGRDALNIMLFDQFANYVVQRMLEIAIEVHEGKRAGDRSWLPKIVEHVKRSANNLQRFSSGKKILTTLAKYNI
ncbi:pumilio domain-containing protein 5 [Ditylenchus destructor]|uniref:Pumilio domain-containing protein 5 n=1 Tax=Ditylenchus destructor TaxID=166010 RepID=A0AAD4N3U8_9BILA|nr:pumilio domain-containing protein 5 [Ditylenchus destructor]